MKTKLRSAKDGSKKAAASQPRNPSSAQAGRAGDIPVLVVSRVDGRVFARVKFPPEIYARMETAAKTLGITIQQFVIRAAEKKLEASGIVLSTARATAGQRRAA
jgi:hypothetical protein